MGFASGGTGDAQGAAGPPAMQGMGNYPPDASGPQVPAGVAQFAVDPFWPQPLPENWILGQVAGQSVLVHPLSQRLQPRGVHPVPDRTIEILPVFAQDL